MLTFGEIRSLVVLIFWLVLAYKFVVRFIFSFLAGLLSGMLGDIEAKYKPTTKANASRIEGQSHEPEKKLEKRTIGFKPYD